MTRQEREEMFAKDFLVAEDLMKLCGCCRAGTEGFVDSLGKTKDRYTIAEIIEITKGQYGAAVFENFFKEE